MLVCFLVGGGGALCFCDRVPGWPGTYYEDQAGFKLMNLLTQSPECWDIPDYFSDFHLGLPDKSLLHMICKRITPI